ncbi:low molecular weight protein-tyrosine-phosphatase [Luteolibacter algae]|uniref:Low molecular weight protein-tyrosine-phosphatase n=1 Tax=Luteolibacter algae TaxID=454151 RepID=A0ABW5DBB1_9BACT
MTRVLFVCMGNICRSPAAEIVFRKMVDAAGIEDRIEIDSAGTIGYHMGNPPDSRMATHLECRGYQVAGRARKLVKEDLATFDLVLVMDEENLADAKALDPSGELHSKIRPFVGYLKIHSSSCVPDPYYGGDDGFAHVIDLLEDGCSTLLKEIS